MPYVTAGIAIGGLAYKAYQDHKAGSEAKKAAEAGQAAANSEADLSDFNASVADLQAQDALQRGADTESRFRTTVRGMIGQQRATFAGGNINVGVGSAVDVQADAAYLGELDAQTIRNNATREAWGFSNQAVDLRKRADIMRKTGVNILAAGQAQQSAANRAAFGDVLIGGASLAEARYGYGRTSSVPKVQQGQEWGPA